MEIFNDLIAIFIQGSRLYGHLHVDFPNSIFFVSVVFEQRQTWPICFKYWLLVTLIFLRLLFFVLSWLPRSGKSQGKTNIFQGQGKVREFFKKSGKIFGTVKLSERSGDSVFRFIVHKSSSKFWNAFSFGKDEKYAAKQAKRSIWHSTPDTCNCGQWFSLWMLSSKFLLPLSVKSGKRLKMKRKISMACKKS